MGSRWASRTGKHLCNPSPRWGRLARSSGLGAGMLQGVAAWLSGGRAAAPSVCPWDRGSLRLLGCRLPLHHSQGMHHRRHLPWLARSVGCSRLHTPRSKMLALGVQGHWGLSLCASPAFGDALAPSLADIANTACDGRTAGAAVSAQQSWSQCEE